MASNRIKPLWEAHELESSGMVRFHPRSSAKATKSHPIFMDTFLSGGVPIRLRCYEPTGPESRPALMLFHGSGGNVDYWLQYLGPATNRLGIALYGIHYFDRTKTQRADPTLI